MRTPLLPGVVDFENAERLGREILLDGNFVLNIRMAFHALTTNALRFRSRDDNGIPIAWSVATRAELKAPLARLQERSSHVPSQIKV